MIIVEKENAIFEAKSIIKDLVSKYSLLSKEEMGLLYEDSLAFQLGHGVYSSLDYESSIIEINLIENYLSNKFTKHMQINMPTEPKSDRLLMLLMCNQMVDSHSLHSLLCDL